jgi:glycogen synthase
MAADGERERREVKNHILFEIATEVAHRGKLMHQIAFLHDRILLESPAVGGIYSVLKSKAPVTTAEYGERYTLIGPLNHQSVSP